MAMNTIGRQMGGNVGRLDHEAIPPSKKAGTMGRVKNATVEQFMYF